MTAYIVAVLYPRWRMFVANNKIIIFVANNNFESSIDESISTNSRKAVRQKYLKTADENTRVLFAKNFE